jgi:hypothetical protein
MSLSKSLKSLFLSKRFSFLQILLLVVVICLILITIAKHREKLLVIELTRKTPLPNIQIMPEAKDLHKPYSKDYSFTTDWFTSEMPIWKKVLAPFAHKPGIQYLEIGVFEGRAAMWMIENILTHPTSHVTGMDLFVGDYEKHYGSFKDRYLSNLELSGADDRATTIQGYSQIELRKLPLDTFHIIYIDGSHVNADVLEDTILCWRLLKKGGILIFDDYGDYKTSDPKGGINTFMRYYGSHFDVIHNGIQLILKKKVS